jgi:uncharacterized protein YlxP (DUF503 family)
VVRSFKDRTIAKFRVSVAEVGELDDPRYAFIGVAVVANEAAHCDSVLADVAALASNLPDAILNDRATEIIPFGHGGAQVMGGFESRARGRPQGDDDDD